MSRMRAGMRRVLVAGLAAGTLALAGCGGDSVAQVPTAQEPAADATAAAESTSSATSDPALQGSAAETAAYLAAQRKWVACVRENGFDLPDPDARGVVSLASFPKSEPKAKKAWSACQSLVVAMPESVAASLNPPLTAAQKATKRKYATCMQTHGAADFPDPGADGNFTSQAWDQTSAGAVRATKACASIVGDRSDTGVGVG